MTPHSLGQGHICQSCAPFCKLYCYSDKATEDNISVQLNTHLVGILVQPMCKLADLTHWMFSIVKPLAKEV